MNDEHILVDLDGTLAKYDGDIETIGAPIQAMMDRVRRWRREGQKVKIFTARVAGDQREKQLPLVQQWLKDHDLEGLEVTNEKTPAAIAVWDDRARQVRRNSGERVGFGESRSRRLIEDLG